MYEVDRNLKNSNRHNEVIKNNDPKSEFERGYCFKKCV